MNQLRGAPRLVAGDWLRAARLYLEFQQALNVCYARAYMLGLSWCS